MKPRWTRAYPTIDAAWQRLAEYLGDDFNPDLTDFGTLRHHLDDEWTRLRPHFYEHSIGYLYDLTFFHYMEVKDAFFDALLSFAADHQLTEIADIGCGIALDAQALLQAGYDVHAYDLDNPSLSYARWRFTHDLEGDDRVHSLAQSDDRHHQLVYALDVLGHADEPVYLIQKLFAMADYVAVNMNAHSSLPRFGSADLHPTLDHEAMLSVMRSAGDLLRMSVFGQTVITFWRT